MKIALLLVKSQVLILLLWFFVLFIIEGNVKSHFEVNKNKDVNFFPIRITDLLNFIFGIQVKKPPVYKFTSPQFFFFFSLFVKESR